MSLLIVSLVLGAALMHASWNALMRRSDDRMLYSVIMTVVIGLSSLPLVFLLPGPTAASWPYLVLSALIHIGYNLLLIELYRHGELGHAYPIARGATPLLVTLGAALLAGEHLSGVNFCGVALVSGGIISLALGPQDAKAKVVGVALATSCCIAAYTVTDGLGARLSGNSLSYAAWMFAVQDVIMVGVYYLMRRQIKSGFDRQDIYRGILGGILGASGYCIIIWAMTHYPMGPISALRETSVVFAALIGWFFLHETLTVRRLGACVVIAAGAACLS